MTPPVVWLPVSGRSMWPLAAPWQISLAPIDAKVQVGDIVAVIAERPGAVLLHRLHSHCDDRVILRGDTRFVADPAVARSALVGRLAGLKLGPIVLPWPRSGVIAWSLRRQGLAWALVAPHLRQLARALLNRNRNVDTLRRSGTV